MAVIDARLCMLLIVMAYHTTRLRRATWPTATAWYRRREKHLNMRGSHVTHITNPNLLCGSAPRRIFNVSSVEWVDSWLACQ